LGDELFSCERIGRGGDMPGLIPGGCPFGELYEALRGVRRVGQVVAIFARISPFLLQGLKGVSFAGSSVVHLVVGLKYDHMKSA
jgi:hypothetical protein